MIGRVNVFPPLVMPRIRTSSARGQAAGLLAGLLLTLGLPTAVAAAPGDLDPSFGGTGKVTTDFGGTDVASAVAVQADGKIVAAGQTNAGSNSTFALARYHADGSLDAGFGAGGVVTTDLGATDQAFAVVVQPDGKILAAGRRGSDVGLARYNPDGSADSTFGTGGRATANFGGTELALAAAIQPDGKIVVAGRSNAGGNFDFLVARFNPDGSLDPSFGAGGRVTTDFSGGSVDRAFALALGPDGKIVVAGDSDANFAVARYNPDGSLDAAFGAGGKVITTFGGADQASSLGIQADGKIVVAGHTDNGTSTDFAVARYNPDGSLDAAFGSGGRVTTNFTGSSDDVASAAAIQFDGKIVVAGNAEENFAVARYNPDGSLDVTFGTEGKVTSDLGGEDVAHAMALQADGQIVVVGESSDNFALARYQGFAPLLLRLDPNRTTSATGDSFRLDVVTENPGPSRLVDVYFGIIPPASAGPALGCPAADAIVFLVDAFAPVLTCLSGPEPDIVPFGQNVTIPAALPLTVISNFFGFVWPPGAPPGTYVFFIVFTRPGGLDVIAIALAAVAFSP
jgi:uncharacterized delta-60 repeat protein